MFGAIVFTNSPIAQSNAVSGDRWVDVFSLQLHHGSLVLSFGPLAIIAAILATIAYVVWVIRFRGGFNSRFEIVEATLKVANIGDVKIRPNTSNIKIAYQAWIELTTRKIALPFDSENDVIVEVYSSFYEAFGKLRELAKTIPANQLRNCSDTRQLVDVMVKVLNYGLRPHLTLWQSKFKRWYATASAEPGNVSLTPQEIQRKYPHYQLLVDDLKKVHTEIVEYTEFLRVVAQGGEKPKGVKSP